jgi:hypothetical protein
MKPLLLAGLLCVALPARAGAYPEFQAFAQKNSGRQVNCGMCHANPDGPNGLKPGQIGALTAAELDRLARARQAFQPGVAVDSPILNAFGDHIIQTIGRTAFIGYRRHPAGLAPALGNASDLDQDGIADAQEFLQGTDPLDSQSGAPWALFVRNLVRFRGHIVMLLLATLAGLYGLNNLLRWFAAIGEPVEEG